MRGGVQGNEGDRRSMGTTTRDGRIDHAGGRLSYMPALDGLRALAVIAVLLYHGNVSWARGGYFGVDAFFVLSGFLITSLLLGEWRSSQARRPAGVLDAARPPPAPGRGPRRRRGRGVRRHGGASRSSCTSCAATRSRRSATSRTGTRSSPTSRTSSSTRRRRRCGTSGRSRSKSSSTCSGRSSCSGCSACGAAPAARCSRGCASLLATGSAVLMAVLYHPGTDPSRVYYGTDTRAQSLLIGALLATLLARRRGIASAARRRALHGGRDRRRGRARVHLVDDLGARGLAVPRRFRARRRARRAGDHERHRAERHRATRRAAVGRRAAVRSASISYGLYLWHWPIYVYLNEDRTQLDGAALLAFRLVVTFAIAIGSYCIVEQPLRHGPAAQIGRGEWPHPSVPRPSRVALVATTSGTVPRAFQEVSAAELSAPPAAPGPVAAGVAVTAPAAPLRVMLVGDSVARSLGPGIGRAGATQGIEFWDGSVPGLRTRDGCRRALVRRVAGPRPTLRAGLARPLARAGRPVPPRCRRRALRRAGCVRSSHRRAGIPVRQRGRDGARRARSASSGDLALVVGRRGRAADRAVLQAVLPDEDRPGAFAGQRGVGRPLQPGAGRRRAPQPDPRPDHGPQQVPRSRRDVDGHRRPGAAVRTFDRSHLSDAGADLAAGWLVPQLLDLRGASRHRRADCGPRSRRPARHEGAPFAAKPAGLRRAAQLSLVAAGIHRTMPLVRGDREQRRHLAAIFLVSLAGLLLEVGYTRIVSYKLWYYYTYLVIGLALLGIGSGGIFVVVVHAVCARRRPTRSSPCARSGRRGRASRRLPRRRADPDRHVRDLGLRHRARRSRTSRARRHLLRALRLVHRARRSSSRRSSVAPATASAASTSPTSLGAGLGCLARDPADHRARPARGHHARRRSSSRSSACSRSRADRCCSRGRGVVVRRCSSLARRSAASAPRRAHRGRRKVDAPSTPPYSGWGPVFRVDVVRSSTPTARCLLLHDGTFGSGIYAVQRRPDVVDPLRHRPAGAPVRGARHRRPTRADHRLRRRATRSSRRCTSGRRTSRRSSSTR